jgi:S1-C subfamily serine protease
VRGSLVDIVLILLVIVFAVNGYRQGFFIGLASFVGFFGGATIGLQLGPWLANFLQNELARVFISLVTVFGLAIAGQALFGWVGARLRSRIRNRTGQTLDDVGGAVVSAVAVLVVAWLVAAPLGSSSLPGLARSVRNSVVLYGIDQVMPDQAKSLSDALRQTVDTRGFPDVFGDLNPTRVRQVAAPDPALVGSKIVAQAKGSVVKVSGSAPSCDRGIEGSGFVFADQRVLTNAHVVAGVTAPSVYEQNGRKHTARIVMYDPNKDLAVLYVPGLTVTPLPFAAGAGRSGADAIVLGYPLDGPFDAQSARIRDLGPIKGPNIYNSATVTRDIYTIRGLVRSGNSGGPLLAADGTVLGVVFAAAADDPQTGFALSDAEAAPIINVGQSATTAVATGSCAEA